MYMKVLLLNNHHHTHPNTYIEKLDISEMLLISLSLSMSTVTEAVSLMMMALPVPQWCDDVAGVGGLCRFIYSPGAGGLGMNCIID